MEVSVEFTANNSAEILAECKSKVEEALTLIGMEARSRASENAPRRTGTLARSYDYLVDEGDQSVQIGARSDAFPEAPYAAYVELGTSRQKPQPHLEPAIMDNLDVYQDIAERTLKN